MKIPHLYLALAAATALGGCANMDLASMGLTGIEDTSASEDLRPPDAEPGACYGREIKPAVFETVTQHVVVTAARYGVDGALITPATYRTDTVQKMVSDRENLWFKTPCPPVWTQEFTASVQRALKARGIYYGRISGEIDSRTRRAIRKYQEPLGINSDTLTLEAARKLGLVAVEREVATKTP
jgi:hypothetical protein